MIPLIDCFREFLRYNAYLPNIFLFLEQESSVFCFFYSSLYLVKADENQIHNQVKPKVMQDLYGSFLE